MREPTCVLVAHDYGESHMMRRIAEGLKWPVHLFLGDGIAPYSDEHIAARIAHSDIALVAMSEVSEMEVAACRAAVECRRPFALIGNVAAWRHRAFADVIPSAEVLFVTTESDASAAREMFPTVDVVVIGNVTIEGAHRPKLSREDVRNRLRIRPEEKLVLFGSEKDVETNVAMISCTLHALSQQENAGVFKTIFGIHPGHFPLRGTPNLRRFYDRVLHQRNDKGLWIRITDPRSGFGITDMLPGADLVIGLASTVLQKAACLRIPAISFMIRSAFRDLNLPDEKGGWWWPCDVGAVAPVYDLENGELPRLIKQLLTEEGFAEMKRAQRLHFPEREEGAAAGIIKRELASLVLC